MKERKKDIKKRARKGRKEGNYLHGTERKAFDAWGLGK
jgi:hypothetical protein